jgi:transcriptional regulator with XRE-family HTH domain
MQEPRKVIYKASLMIYNFTLGMLIKQCRIIKGYTQTELAGITGISESCLSRIERGLTFPSTQVLISLAKPLDLDKHDLLVCSAYTALNYPEIVSDDILYDISSALKKLKYRYRKETIGVANEGGGN